NDGADVRWSAVSMPSSQARRSGQGRWFEDYDGHWRIRRSDQGAEPGAADASGAKAALDRVSIPEEAVARISRVVSPGSAVIIPDEALSRETGRGTALVVLGSGEPQGGIKIRRRPSPWGDYERPYGRRSPYYSPDGRASPSFWW